MNFGLAGRAAIVTGAAQGIGAACARRLAADGMALALWDVDTARGEALAAELRGQGANALFLRCDVASKADVEAALADTLTALPRIHALVNNAGIFKAAAFLDISEADWDAVIGVNLKMDRLREGLPKTFGAGPLVVEGAETRGSCRRALARPATAIIIATSTKRSCGVPSRRTMAPVDVPTTTPGSAINVVRAPCVVIEMSRLSSLATMSSSSIPVDA